MTDEISTLAAALRQKFKTPMEALRVLGLDAALIEEVHMPSPQQKPRQPPRLSPAAAITRSALWTFLTPRLAQDAQINYGALVQGITSKNYAERLPGLGAAVTAAVNGKLAEDADITDLANLLNALKPDAQQADQAVTAPGAGPPMGGGGAPPPPADGEPEDILAKIKKYLEQEGVSPDIINNLDAFIAEGGGPPPNGGGPPPDGGPPGAGPPGPPNGDGELDTRGETCPADLIEDAGEDGVVPSEQKDLITRDAMNKAIKQAQDRAIANQREIRAAERFVRPWVGEMAMDSAAGPADVLRAALKALNVAGADKMHADALKPVLEAQPKPSRRIAQDRVLAANLATDGTATGSFAERFPEAKHITMQ